MSDHHDRGAYTPQSDAPLAFDARSSRRGGSQPMPVTLIISGVILIILVAAMVVFFIHNAHDNGAPPSAGQSIDAIKSPPLVPDAKPADAGVQIGYTQGNPPIPTDANTASASGAPTFTPPPEAPGVRPAPGATPAPGKPQTIDAILKEAPPKPAPKTSDEIIAAAESAKPAPTMVKPKSDVPTVAAPKPAPKVEAKPAPKVATKASGPMVQIGAFSTQALAEQSMNSVAAKVPGRVAGKTLKVEKAEVDGKTLNRALIGGFTSRADADSFCTALKAQGGVCSVRD
jgi:cell division septation protein DedD